MHHYHSLLLRLLFLFPALLNLMNTLLVYFSYFNVSIGLNPTSLHCSGYPEAANLSPSTERRSSHIKEELRYLFNIGRKTVFSDAMFGNFISPLAFCFRFEVRFVDPVIAVCVVLCLFTGS